MPHKHKRDRLKFSSSINLPPSQIAYPLPITKKFLTQTKPSKRKSKPIDDDTPHAFTRLLGAYRPPRSGLDDGTRLSKKGESAPSGFASDIPNLLPTKPEPAIDTPTRHHGESLSAFAARVDVALPLSGIEKKSGRAKGIDKGRQTRTERKMHRMYQEWREQDRRMRKKAEEAAIADECDDDEEVVKAMGIGEAPSKRKGRKGERKHGAGGRGKSSDDEDPWAKIAAKRKDTEGKGGLVGLHDVVQAPPRFTKVPKGKENFKVGQGGLKRQADLSEARQSVVEGYRQMMKDKRAQVIWKEHN